MAFQRRFRLVARRVDTPAFRLIYFMAGSDGAQATGERDGQPIGPDQGRIACQSGRLWKPPIMKNSYGL